MTDSSHPWHTWAKTLQHWGGGSLIADLLEAAGPLTLFGAQAIYVGQPLLKQLFSPTGLNAVAEMLENPQELQEFITCLRQRA